ncbi:MAG: hypothetical protein HQK92_09405 [Nitrospirae bacterium]|nr:hypothetical protein [Nitrospirota bacterium]
MKENDRINSYKENLKENFGVELHDYDKDEWFYDAVEISTLFQATGT